MDFQRSFLWLLSFAVSSTHIVCMHYMCYVRFRLNKLTNVTACLLYAMEKFNYRMEIKTMLDIFKLVTLAEHFIQILEDTPARKGEFLLP